MRRATVCCSLTAASSLQRRAFISSFFGGGKTAAAATEATNAASSSTTDAPPSVASSSPTAVSTATSVCPMSPRVCATASATAASFPRSVEEAKGAFVGNFPAQGAKLEATDFYNKVPFLRPDATLVEASAFLSHYDLGCVPVLNDEAPRSVIGMLSERDLARWIASSHSATTASSADTAASALPSPRTTLVRDIMVKDVIFCTDETTLEEALAIMDKHNFRHLPVMSSKLRKGCGTASGDVAQRDLVGLLSMRDIMHQHVRGAGKGDVDDFMSWVLRMSR